METKQLYRDARRAGYEVTEGRNGGTEITKVLPGGRRIGIKIHQGGVAFPIGAKPGPDSHGMSTERNIRRVLRLKPADVRQDFFAQALRKLGDLVPFVLIAAVVVAVIWCLAPVRLEAVDRPVPTINNTNP